MNSPPGRKRRATRACCHCRGRKVRCDVMEYGSPCTNCRLDRVDCLTLERRRKRTADELKKCAQMCSTEHHQGSNLRVLAKTSPSGSPGSPETSPLFGREVETGFILPQYTRALPLHLDQDDMRFLAKKGALSVPVTFLRNKLLTSYAHHVHSDMPLLDLDALVRPIIQNDTDHPVSLLLIHVVFFAAATFVDIQDLQAAGFESRIHARKEFFQRGRLLYEFDYEQDRITLVQALLLMSFWEESSTSLKGGWHWLGLALSVAQTIGLHRKTKTAGEDARRIRTRLWWCIYARDCLMALDMRHPMHINNLEFETEQLMIDHFELELSEPTVSSIGYSGLLGNAEHQRSLAVIFIEKVRLCHHIKTVFESQYSVGVDTVARVVPRRLMHNGNEVSDFAQDLHRWELNLAPEARCASTNIVNFTKAEGILHAQRSSLKMTHLTLIGALYRPHIHLNHFLSSEVSDMSRLQLFGAGDQITNIAQNLSSSDLIQLLPATAVAALYSAGVAYLVGVQDGDRHGDKFYQMRMCLRYLADLRELHSTAGSAVTFLEILIARIMPLSLKGSGSSEHSHNFRGSNNHGKLSMTSQQSTCFRYSESESGMTDNAESAISGPSPESYSIINTGLSHEDSMIVDVESEIALGEMLGFAGSKLETFDKGCA